MAIKFDDNLNERIRRIVKNFNAKVRYNKYKTRGKGMLPEKISVRTLKDKYSDKSRSELEKQLKLYQSFGQREALDITENRLSKWEKNYFKANLQKTKDFYDKEIDELNRISNEGIDYQIKFSERLLTLKAQRAELDKDLSDLTESQIKGFRRYFEYAERSEITKAKAFRHYLNQLERTMDNLGYSKAEINDLFNKFNQLTENEFMEMVRHEDLIDRVYDLIDSPKERGIYELMAEEDDARSTIDAILDESNDIIAKYKKSK
ncbi:MAG: hypothetical protein J6S85_24250 [Methanobrevibacter sp.]|nr:hypothetical protein [Methanobrevibacter sp.]